MSRTKMPQARDANETLTTLRPDHLFARGIL
jgi:hypothetical protein